MVRQLAKDKTTVYSIVRAADADKAIVYACEELSHFLGRITGAVFPIHDDTMPRGEKEIWIGKSNRTESLELDWPVCDEEGYFLKTVGQSLLAAGNTGRGTLYAVYAFLEEELGCRWFTPAVDHIPARTDLALPILDKQYTPPFRYRCVGGFIEVQNGDWMARNRLNGGPLTEKHGGAVSIGGGHSFNGLVPVAEFFQEHPEYFSEINGKRIGIYDKDGRPAQLCLTNPAVLEIVTRKVLERLENNPEGVVSVAQNDASPPCACEKCLAVDLEEESNAGTLIRFVNAVAAEVKKQYPKARIFTYAYNHTRRPPKITRPLDNIIIQLCTGECCFAHPIEECKDVSPVLGMNRHEFLEDLSDWGKISDNIYIFDYPTDYNFLMLPHPIQHVFRPNMEFFARCGIRGVYECGPGTPGAYCAELKSYVLAKSLWNPLCDDKKVQDEFLTGVYGMAGSVMGRIFDGYKQEIIDEGLHIGDSLFVDVPYNRPGFLESQDKRFDEAERLADDNAKLLAVQKARLWQRFAVTVKKDHKNKVAQAEMEALVNDCKAFGISRFCIHHSFDYWLTRWKDRRFQD